MNPLLHRPVFPANAGTQPTVRGYVPPPGTKSADNPFGVIRPTKAQARFVPALGISREISAHSEPPLTGGRAKPTQRRLRDMDVAKAPISTGTYCRGGPPGAWGCAREVRLRRTRMSGQDLCLLWAGVASHRLPKWVARGGETRNIRTRRSGALRHTRRFWMTRPARPSGRAKARSAQALSRVRGEDEGGERSAGLFASKLAPAFFRISPNRPGRRPAAGWRRSGSRPPRWPAMPRRGRCHARSRRRGAAECLR